MGSLLPSKSYKEILISRNHSMHIASIFKQRSMEKGAISQEIHKNAQKSKLFLKYMRHVINTFYSAKETKRINYQ